ncbi:hypothetical protein [Pseudomonas asplenii]|uniref:hypothetical protein n=1 Tax=Pseudomonas asplenii TaxID=53407 RepID=UPI0012FA33D1|nr:hypothetical protein [Pseudomonas fuscovaginae]
MANQLLERLPGSDEHRLKKVCCTSLSPDVSSALSTFGLSVAGQVPKDWLEK